MNETHEHEKNTKRRILDRKVRTFHEYMRTVRDKLFPDLPKDVVISSTLRPSYDEGDELSLTWSQVDRGCGRYWYAYHRDPETNKRTRIASGETSRQLAKALEFNIPFLIEWDPKSVKKKTRARKPAAPEILSAAAELRSRAAELIARAEEIESLHARAVEIAEAGQ